MNPNQWTDSPMKLLKLKESLNKAGFGVKMLLSDDDLPLLIILKPRPEIKTTTS